MKINRDTSIFRFSFLVLSVIVISVNFLFAQSQDNPSPIKFPTPKGIPNQLFYLQRDPNTNTIICQLNLDKYGKLNKNQPINTFWMRYAEDNNRQELNYIQRKFAYGIQSKEIGNGQYLLNFVSYKKLSMHLSNQDGDYHVYVNVNKKKLKVERIFVRIEGGSFWVPNVRYVEFKGIDTQHPDKLITERIKI